MVWIKQWSNMVNRDLVLEESGDSRDMGGMRWIIQWDKVDWDLVFG